MTIITSPFPAVELRAITITERVFEGLRDDPEKVVLTDGPTGRQMTAAAFMQAVKSLAGGLNGRGTGKGTMVALMAPNLPEYAVVFHGVAWAGGTVTLINPTYTPHEVQHQLRDSGATLLITIPHFLDTAKAAVEGTEVAEIAVIGDNSHDLEMARSGGAGLAIGVLSGNGTREALEPLADVILASVADLPSHLGVI